MIPAGAVKVRVPAKINLALAVGDLRDDGYHDLLTVFHAVNLCDDVTIAKSARWSVKCETPDVPTDSTNLALRAARRLANECQAAFPVSISIAKAIPVAGGMAGGSADAAAALVGCAALWRSGHTREELGAIAAELGADVPFALHGGTAIGVNRGDSISPVLTRMELHWVIALPGGGLSTPAVFAELDRLRAQGLAESSTDLQAVLKALTSGDVGDVGQALGNDLQAAAISLAPDLRRTFRAAKEAEAVAALLCGSGSSIALLCRDADDAEDIALQMAGSGTVAGVRVVHGPAQGARIIEG